MIVLFGQIVQFYDADFCNTTMTEAAVVAGVAPEAPAGVQSSAL